MLLVLPEFWFTVLAGLEVAVPVPGRPVQHMSAELRLVMMQLSNSWSVYVPHYVQNLDILSIKWTKIQATLYFYQTLRDYRVQIYSGQPQKFYEISKVIWHLFSKPQINVTLSSYFFFFLDNWNIIPFPNKNNFWVENVHL